MTPFPPIHDIMTLYAVKKGLGDKGNDEMKYPSHSYYQILHDKFLPPKKAYKKLVDGHGRDQ